MKKIVLQLMYCCTMARWLHLILPAYIENNTRVSGHTNVSEHFPKFPKNNRRFPTTTAEDPTEDVSIVHLYNFTTTTLRTTLRRVKGPNMTSNVTSSISSQWKLVIFTCVKLRPLLGLEILVKYWKQQPTISSWYPNSYLDTSFNKLYMIKRI